jgi:RNA polymerase sigma-70 factor (ECF subfamily)
VAPEPVDPGGGARTLARDDYGRLVEACLGQAVGYARSILRHHADAEDAVQQAALRGMERLASYDQRRPFKAWWFTVLRHCCIDLVRARSTHRPLDAAGPVAAPAAPEPPAAWHELARALERLDPDHAAILRLRYFGELSYDELSQALEIPRGTVMSRLHYARARLSALMPRTTP